MNPYLLPLALALLIALPMASPAQERSQFPERLPGEPGVWLTIHIVDKKTFEIDGVNFSARQLGTIIRMVKPVLREVVFTTDGKPTPDSVKPAMTVLGLQGVKGAEFRQREAGRAPDEAGGDEPAWHDEAPDPDDD